MKTDKTRQRAEALRGILRHHDLSAHGVAAWLCRLGLEARAPRPTHPGCAPEVRVDVDHGEGKGRQWIGLEQDGGAGHWVILSAGYDVDTAAAILAVWGVWDEG